MRGVFYHRPAGLELHPADSLHAFAVLGRAALHDAEDADQFAEPVGEAVGELEFEDDLVGKAQGGIVHLRLDGVIEAGFAIDLAVDGHAGLIVVAHVGFAHVENVDLGLGVEMVGHFAEPLQGDEAVRILRDQVFLLGQVAPEQQRHTFLPHAAALLLNGVVLAALDLELRGAGNILGGQQSGHLDALGFDLYTKMLERTIAEIRGDDIADETSVSINLGVDVSIPKDYISDTSQRLRTYKRISSAETEAVLMQIHQEIEDRYGKIPESVENLFAYGRLRKLSEEMSIVSIDKAANGIAIKLGENTKVSPERLVQFLSEHEDANFSPNGILRVVSDGENPISASRSVLEQIRNN